MDNKNKDIKSEPSSFLVQDYTPKNTISLNKSGSKSSFVKEEKYEFNAPKYYDFEAGTPSTNVDSWFDTLVDTPCNKTMISSRMMNSQEKKLFTPPSNNIKETPTNKNNDKGKEIEKEEKEYDNIKELKNKVKKENVETIKKTGINKEKTNANLNENTYSNTNINTNTNNDDNTNDNNTTVHNKPSEINNNVDSNITNSHSSIYNNINTNTSKLSNILSSWDTHEKNKITNQANENIKQYLTNSFRTEIHNLNRGKSRKRTEKIVEQNNKIENFRIKSSKPILTSKPVNINTSELRTELFVKREKSRLSETSENEKPVEFESRINTILKFKNTLRRQSKQYKRKLKLTIPKSPNITKVVPRKSRDNWIVKPVMEKKKSRISLEKLFSKPFEIQVPHRMLPLPKFSLSSDKLRQQRLSQIKQNLIKEQESDQQKAEFHASEASNIILSNRTNVNVVERLYHIKRNVPAIEKKENVYKFKARPVPKLKPFIIKRIDKPLTEAISPILHSEIRMKERQLFDEKVHQHQMEMEKLQKEMELEKEKREKIWIKQLRKKIVHHAKPAPNPNLVFRIKPSHQQLTIPKSPSFGHQRPYKTIQMNSIHRQMDHRIRNLSHESKSLKGRIKNLNSEPKEIDDQRRISNEESIEFDENDISRISYASTSSSYASNHPKESESDSLSSSLLKINHPNKLLRKNTALTTTPSVSTTTTHQLEPKKVSSETLKKTIKKEVPTRSLSSSALMSVSSSMNTSTSPLTSPISRSKSSRSSFSVSSSVTLKNSRVSTSTDSLTSKASNITTDPLKPVKSEQPEVNLSTSRSTSTKKNSIGHHQDQSESFFNSLASDISKTVTLDNASTHSSTSAFSDKHSSSTTTKVLKNIQQQQQQKQLKRRQDQEKQLQQHKKQKQKQQEQEKQSQELRKQEKEKLKKFMSKDFNYQGQEKFLQQVKQKQKVQEQLLQQQAQQRQQEQEQKQVLQEKEKQQEQNQQQKPLVKVKKEVTTSPKDTRKLNSTTKSLKNTHSSKQEISSSNDKINSQKEKQPQPENNLLSSPISVLDMFSPAKKRPFPSSTEYNKKRNLSSSGGKEDHQPQNESHRTQKLFDTIHNHQTKSSVNPTTTSNLPELSSQENMIPSNIQGLQKRTKARSKSFIDTNRNTSDYTQHQKARLSDVSMNIKQNILNDIMSFSPIMNTDSPSPFILSEKDRQKLKKRNLFSSPQTKKFEVAQRESSIEHEQRRKSEFLNKILYGDKIKKEKEEKEERSKQNTTKAENYKVQWITIDEIKKNKRSDETGGHLPFEITPLKTSLSDLDTPRHPTLPLDNNLYKTPENHILHSHPLPPPPSEEEEINESSTKISSLISKVTRRTSRRLRPSLIN
ncbi:hypothetical protein BCR36DRAFT_350870 [Piromyces finnis]|uniref:TPX2 C-terminal domain-containing protein n=1 Tax=Piromyces finnis TaxID=1754191 RepID=A0A1Y1VBA3_9FUNG|nr:hypothetical protein BCR36DRAFT_350870 [Piromyces finnis]|eukprot:ORX51840.1 hypothetical protein BCR36DRAFT_350870 [Piromyces finnis]